MIGTRRHCLHTQLSAKNYKLLFTTDHTEYTDEHRFPPGKTATVGANAANVQATMQMSTDLVDWTPALNGQVYTNSPDARFFRIQLLTNISP